MGRLRIKKKDAVIPFRETLAYRLLLATASLLILMFTLYQFLSAIGSRNMTLMIVAGGASVMAVTALFYNLGQVRNARVPERSLRRAGRR